MLVKIEFVIWYRVVFVIFIIFFCEIKNGLIDLEVIYFGIFCGFGE